MWIRVVSSLLLVAALAAPAAAEGVTIYLNRDGATLRGGWDDSAANVSSVALNAGGEVTVPAWRGGDRAWRAVVACVRAGYEAFAVDVVTERPGAGDYVMVVVGGTPRLVGYPRSVSGVAPYTGALVPNAVAYVFAASLDHEVEATCTAILHESGHALGLDHSTVCEDPMSYAWGCGEKRWQDVDGACGEDEARFCGDGEPTQNSWRRLAATVGLRDDAAPAPPGDEPLDDGPPFDRPIDPADDLAAPAVAIDGADEELAGDRWIEVVVRAVDDGEVADVELGWASEEAQYVFRCSVVDDEVPVTCTRDGDTFRFRLRVGTGLRAMVARATDRAGNQAVSDPRVIYFTPRY